MNNLVYTKDFVVILIDNLISIGYVLGIVTPWSWPRQSIITEQGTKEFPSFIPCSIPQGRTMRVPSRPPPRSRPRRRESWGLNPQPPLHWVSLLDAVRVCVPSENVREYVIDWPKRNVRKSFWNPIAVLVQYFLALALAGRARFLAPCWGWLPAVGWLSAATPQQNASPAS